MADLDKLSELLLRLSIEKKWETADEICGYLSGFFGISVERFRLWQDPRIVSEASRFMTAFETINNPAAYEAKHSNEKAVDVKLYWMKKTTKTNLSWVVGAADNFEDGKTTAHRSVGIDFVIPESCDKVIIILSKNFKLRVLELQNRLNITDREILINIKKTIDFVVKTVEEKEIFHNSIFNALNFEPINRRFYKELVEKFYALKDHLVTKKFADQDSVHFCTHLLGRLLFVWFLRKKNLINEGVGYFEVGNLDQKKYYKEKLEKLFFEVLNKEPLERGFTDNQTPYLNGGLFEATRTDFYQDSKLSFPENYFNDFYEVLAKYNFTVDESSPEFEQVAVDPEMLGRIFESLLAEQKTETGEQARKAKGAFYTPREIVSYMCEQSLIEYLKTKVAEDNDRDLRIKEIVTLNESAFRDQDHNKRRDWKPYVKDILAAMDQIKIFDPAVGSGAFPMGMLHLLVKVYTRLDSKYEKNLSKLKRDILSRSLYGSDIDPTAIEISRLRAWLSMIVDVNEKEQIIPLPNLEFHFVCANTLISLPKEKGLFDTDGLHDKMKVLREEYYNTNSKDKKDTLRNKFKKLLSPDLSIFGGRDNELKTYQPFNHESRASFFDPDLMFGISEGFDVVIGNPPYVNVEKVDQKIKDIISNFITAFQKYDLYVLFYEKGLSLLNKNGVLSYITSNKFLSQSYGKLLRQEMLKQRLISIINFDYDIFDSAVVRTCVMIIQNSFIENNIVKVINVENKNDRNKFDSLSYSNVDQAIFNSTEENNFRINLTSNKIKILSKIKEGSILLEEICSVNYGLRPSGKDNGTVKKDLISKEKIDGYKPYFEGKNMGTWLVKESSYLKYNPKEMYNPMFDELFTNNKLVGLRTLSDITKLRFIYDDQGLYCNDSVVILTIWNLMENIDNLTINRTINKNRIENSKKYDYKYLQGILNSKLIKFYVNELMYDGTHFYPNHMKALPIKVIKFENKKLVEGIINNVGNILKIKKENKDADTSDLEKEIDILVYELYGLTEEEIKIVEGSK